MAVGKSQALIFNIERSSGEDGPGIRTVVFLKGCDLRCKWCANPESQEFFRQIIVNTNICKQCSRCMNICPQKAIYISKDGAYVSSPQLCNGCEACVDGCYAGARSVSGRRYTSDELVAEVLKDSEYFHLSQGGVTFSGGEPLFYADFIRECAEEVHKSGINVLIETCGFVSHEKIAIASECADYIFYDIKHMNEYKHIEYTGKGNRKILENLRWLDKNFKGKLCVRCPVIPGLNDSAEEIEELLDFVSSLDNAKEIWFLPYHRLGFPKYVGLGREYKMGDMKSLKFSDIAYLKEHEKKYRTTIRI